MLVTGVRSPGRRIAMVHSNGSPKRKVTGVQLFEPGVVVGTPGTVPIMDRHNLNPYIIIARHVSGDWGDVGTEDALSNEEALKHGARLMSVYKFGDDSLWVITEADRSSTTILTPDEY
jgi:hypothetical protein